MKIRGMAALVLATCAGVALGALAGGSGGGDEGVTDKSILLGQPAALKGPAEALGKGMQAGLIAAFTEVNAAGGVNGRMIELKSLNDSYEPDKCAQATQMLIEKMNVFSIIGAVGTPTSKVAVPICTEAKVPFIGPFTGAELLRDPVNPYVLNVRASYYQETEELAKLLVDENGFTRIACFYQNDAFGQAGLAGIARALQSRNITLCAEATFERNTVAIAEGFATIAASNPQAVLMVGPYKPCAEIVRAGKNSSATKDTTFCTISFVGTEAFVSDIKDDGEGVVISQVVPFPWDTSVPVVSAFHHAMNAANATDQIGFISLEGYIAGTFFAQAVSTIDGVPTREGLLSAINATGSFDVNGFDLTFSESDRQGSDRVFLTRLVAGKVVPFDGGPLANVTENTTSEQ